MGRQQEEGGLPAQLADLRSAGGDVSRRLVSVDVRYL